MFRQIIENLKIIICNTIQSKIPNNKNEYYLRILDKNTREVKDIRFNELSDIVKHYRNNIFICTNEIYNKNYYIVRKIDNIENVIEL